MLVLIRSVLPASSSPAEQTREINHQQANRWEESQNYSLIRLPEKELVL